MQAARGTSVTTGSTPRLRLVLGLVAVTAYAVDQASKAVAVAMLDGKPDVQVVGDLLRLHLTRNPGAAFSLGTDFTPVLSVIAVAAVLAVLWFARRVGSLGWAWALGLLLAGVAGNLTDRLVRPPGVLHGHVIDFLRLPNWPIFNVADICINVAAGLIVILAFRGIRLDGSREFDTAAPGPSPEVAAGGDPTTATSRENESE